MTDPLGAEPGDVETRDALQPHRERTRGWLRRVLEETRETQLDEGSMDVYEGTRVCVAEVLAHILPHERAHHGDINGLVERTTGRPASDYLVHVYFRDRTKGAG